MKRAVRILVFLLALAAAGAGAQERTIHPLQVGLAAGTLLRLNLEFSSLIWEDA